MTAQRQLRDYQATDAQAVRDAWAAGITRPAIVAATGLGKSDVIAALATDEARAGGRVLLLAHRGELLDQLRDRCRAYAPNIRVGRVQAATREYGAPIVVATVQTAARAPRRARMLRPSLVIVDEAHHAAARTYYSIMEWAGCYADDAPTRALGVTATMSRADRPVSGGRSRGLGDVWQAVVAERGIAWGIMHGPDPADPHTTLPVGSGPGHAPSGWLVPLRGRVVIADHLDLDRATVNRATRDYADADLGEMISQDAPEVVKAWWQHARLPDGSHRITGAFTPTVAAATALCEAFCAAGIAAEMVTGATPVAVRGSVARRSGIYGRIADGRTQVLVSVGVLTEGWDAPPVSCILMARPTRLDHLYQQCIGRGTRRLDPAAWRRHDGTLPPPKTDLLVLDVVGAARHVHVRTLVDLVPGAPYRGRPCPACAQPRPCGCPAAAPDDRGGESDGTDRTDTRRRLIGPADYEDIDLLNATRDTGLNWLITFPTSPEYDGIGFLRAGDLYGLLWHEADGTWSGGWATRRGPHDGAWLVEHTSREAARAAVESHRDPLSGLVLAECADRTDTPWRTARKRPSEPAQRYARSLGIADPHTYTAGGLADLIERTLATRRLVRDF